MEIGVRVAAKTRFWNYENSAGKYLFLFATFIKPDFNILERPRILLTLCTH